MLSRASAVASCLSLAALLAAGQSVALELPLPPEGEDVVGQIRVIKAKYEDTFAAIAETNDLGYSELVAANPGVDPWLPGEGTDIILPTRFILPPGPREGIVINIAEYRLYYYPAGGSVVHTYPLGHRARRLGFASRQHTYFRHDRQPGMVSAQVHSRRARGGRRSVADGGAAGTG